jgi:hypothetical protein
VEESSNSYNLKLHKTFLPFFDQFYQKPPFQDFLYLINEKEKKFLTRRGKLTHFLEWRRKEAQKLCQEIPCLWEFDVERTHHSLNIDLGIKSNRTKRPSITFKKLKRTPRFLVVFLTTKKRGRSYVDLSLCHKECEGFKVWKRKVWIFRKGGKKVFKLPKLVFEDRKLVKFCSTCKEELGKRIEDELHREVL